MKKRDAISSLFRDIYCGKGTLTRSALLEDYAGVYHAIWNWASSMASVKAGGSMKVTPAAGCVTIRRGARESFRMVMLTPSATCPAVSLAQKVAITVPLTSVAHSGSVPPAPQVQLWAPPS